MPSGTSRPQLNFTSTGTVGLTNRNTASPMIASESTRPVRGRYTGIASASSMNTAMAGMSGSMATSVNGGADARELHGRDEQPDQRVQRECDADRPAQLEVERGVRARRIAGIDGRVADQHEGERHPGGAAENAQAGRVVRDGKREHEHREADQDGQHDPGIGKGRTTPQPRGIMWVTRRIVIGFPQS